MFSDQEQKIIKIIGNREMSIGEVTKWFYDNDIPFEGNNRVAAIIRRIRAKCEINKLNWTIEGEGVGRNGKVVWKEKVKR